MHPKVNSTYQRLAEKYEMSGPFLEVGVGNREAAILSGSYFLGRPERFATNLSDKEILEEPEQASIQFIRCNSNDMRAVFAEGQFGTVLSNAVIEHDKYFWRSLDEMKRILAPGGILAIGAPAYVPRTQLKDTLDETRLSKATITMDLHAMPDYWRFSRMAFEEVICEGLELLELCVVGRVPVMLAVARKPLNGLLPPVAQEDRVQIYPAEETAKVNKREGKVPARDAKQQSRKARPVNMEAEAAGPAAAKPRKNHLKKEYKLQLRAERLQARDAKKLAREARLQAREATVASPAPAPGEGEKTKPSEGKIKSLLRLVQKRHTAKTPEDAEG